MGTKNKRNIRHIQSVTTKSSMVMQLSSTMLKDGILSIQKEPK